MQLLAVGNHMSIDVHSLGIDRLSVGERLELIDQIWESLPQSIAPSDVPAWHLAELAKRRSAVADDLGVGKPWREVLDGLKN